MQLPLKNYVSSFVYNLQRIFRMPSDSQARPYPELYLGNSEVDIKGYTLHLRDAYGGRPKDALMKNLGVASEHESLQLELRDPNGQMHCMYFEQGRDADDAGDRDAAKSKAAPAEIQPDMESESPASSTTSLPPPSSPQKFRRRLSSTPSSSSSSPHSSSTSLSKEGDALDSTVTFARRGRRHNEVCMHQLDFEKKATAGDPTNVTKELPPVYQVAVLANTSNTQGSRYHLLNSNCYHFLGMLYAILKELHHPYESVTPGVRDGTWNRVPVYSPPPITKIFSVIDDYRVDLEKFEAEVAERHKVRDEDKKKRIEAEAKVKALEEDLEAYKNAAQK